MRLAAFLCLSLLLAGCVRASVETADGTSASLWRLWTDTSFTVDPATGAISYSSNPQSDILKQALELAATAVPIRAVPLEADEPQPLFRPQAVCEVPRP